MEYTDTVGWMLCQHSNYDIVTTSRVDKNKALLGVYIKKVLNALGQSLVTNSEQYRSVLGVGGGAIWLLMRVGLRVHN